MPGQAKRAPKGSVGLESFQGRLRLRLPRQLFGGKQKYLSLGLTDTPTHRKFALAKAQLIESDIVFERFDPTLAKYSQPPACPASAASATAPTVLLLWQRYAADRKPGLKPKTGEKYDSLERLFAKIAPLRVDEPLAVKQALLEVATLSRTKDALAYLAAACEWGLKHHLVLSNPFAGMAKDLPKHRYQRDPQPNAFTTEEAERVLQAFQAEQRQGKSYGHYAPLVEFLLYTGCRPSEAVGLQWQHVADDGSSIRFESALVQVGNRRIRSEGSKNNRTRTLATSERVQRLLQAMRPVAAEPEALVFPGPQGGSINYRNFSRRAWAKLVNPIKPDTTPYSCRDTFITRQLLQGIPSTIVAKWCDTSTQMIDKYYADRLKLAQLRPRD